VPQVSQIFSEDNDVTHITLSHIPWFAGLLAMGSRLHDRFIEYSQVLTTSNYNTLNITLRLGVYCQSVRLGTEPLETHDQSVFSQLNTCGDSPFVTSSLTRIWIYHLQLLLLLASAVILWSESRGTRDHIFLSQIRDFPLLVLMEIYVNDSLSCKYAYRNFGC
jgi:hypothetical protein